MGLSTHQWNFLLEYFYEFHGSVVALFLHLRGEESFIRHGWLSDLALLRLDRLFFGGSLKEIGKWHNTLLGIVLSPA
jgi:hypothetical protein